MPDPLFDTVEGRRMLAAERGEDWRRWGPYLSERQWGTVREDYSPGGTAWDSFPHDHARMPRLPLGGGRAGRVRRRQAAVVPRPRAVERPVDPILKERLFGLTNAQGNHGEDAEGAVLLPGRHADPFLHADALQIPAGRLPVRAAGRGEPSPGHRRPRVRAGRHRRLRGKPLLRASSSSTPRRPFDDILMLVTAHNRGPDAAPLHVLPQLWSRNTWSWEPGAPRPLIRLDPGQGDGRRVLASHPALSAHPRLRGGRRRRLAVLREPDQRQPPVRRTAAGAVQGRHQRPRSGRGVRRHKPAQARHQVRRALPADNIAPGGSATSAPAPASRNGSRSGPRTPSPGSTR